MITLLAFYRVRSKASTTLRAVDLGHPCRPPGTARCRRPSRPRKPFGHGDAFRFVPKLRGFRAAGMSASPYPTQVNDATWDRVTKGRGSPRAKRLPRRLGTGLAGTSSISISGDVRIELQVADVGPAMARSQASAFGNASGRMSRPIPQPHHLKEARACSGGGGPVH